ncbi:MAG: ABC transporter permease [Actinomycetota bacterium]|nr:MAG: ABC transporter permease [Actinomycetota bacterium]
MDDERSRKIKHKAGALWGNFGLPFIFIIVLVVFSVQSPIFVSWRNLLSTLGFSSYIAMAAIGMTFIIMTGNFDISIGSMLALVAVLGSSFIPRIGGVFGVISTLVIAAFLGLINGLFVTKLRIPAFITTLGMLFIFRALAFIYTNNYPVYIDNKFWLFIGNGKILNIPFPIFITAICYTAAYLVLRRSPLGRYVVAVGTNPRAAELSGINVDNIKIFAFTFAGFFVGVAAVINTATMGAANPGLLGQNYEFQVITAVVLGGTLLGGGNGSLGGALIAAMIITFLGNGMGLLQVGSYWQLVVTGAVMIIAVSLNKLKFYLLGQGEL